MPYSKLPHRAEPCVWMSAGLLAYKLCDRDFDCEQCPLDAALRGHAQNDPRPAALLAPEKAADSFPDDRLYAAGHSWVQATGASVGRLLRFGLDVFAASLIGRCRHVSCRVANCEIAQGELLCEIDLGLGMLFLAAPVTAMVVACNERLEQDPNQLITAPYGDGWIAELQLQDPTQLRGLVTASAARERTRLDLRHFRRRVALQLLADAQSVGPCLPDGGEPADLRQMLAGPAYLDLVRQLVH